MSCALKSRTQMRRRNGPSGKHSQKEGTVGLVQILFVKFELLVIAYIWLSDRTLHYAEAHTVLFWFPNARTTKLHNLYLESLKIHTPREENQKEPGHNLLKQ